MMEVKNIGNQNTNLIEDIGNQDTNSWHSLFFLSFKLKTKQCKELRTYLSNNVVAAFDQK
jgi:hypothetical protein